MKLEIQILEARNRILGVEHPHTIIAIIKFAATYKCLGKHTDGEKLHIQAQEVQSRVFEGEHSHKINTISKVEEVQETQVLDTRTTVPEEETSD